MKNRCLTQKEKEIKDLFSQYQTFPNPIERDFHHRMQNPEDGTVSIVDHPAHPCLHLLPDYFCEDGKHLFDERVHSLSLFSLSLQETGRVSIVADLIRKAPLLKTLDLSQTQLTDNHALLLVEALDQNIHLLELKLNGNNLSKDVVDKITWSLHINKAEADFRQGGRNWRAPFLVFTHGHTDDVEPVPTPAPERKCYC